MNGDQGELGLVGDGAGCNIFQDVIYFGGWFMPSWGAIKARM